MPPADDTISRFKDLSPARQRLLVQMQCLGFGRIEQLVITGGEPVIDSLTNVVREVKFAGDNGPRPELRLADYALKAQHLDLLALLDRIGDGSIRVLTVKHGLPFHAEVAG